MERLLVVTASPVCLNVPLPVCVPVCVSVAPLLLVGWFGPDVWDLLKE